LPFVKGNRQQTRHLDPPASMLALLSGLDLKTGQRVEPPSPKPPIPTPTGNKIPPKPKPSYIEQLQSLRPDNTTTGHPRAFTGSYMEQLRQGAYPQRVEAADVMMQATAATHAHAALDTPLYAPLAALLAHTLASGRDRISGQEIFWRLRLDPKQQRVECRAIARVLRALGWVKVHYGKNGGHRVWGWRWREWNVSQVKIDTHL
jgi:hypothetical protein